MRSFSHRAALLAAALAVLPATAFAHITIEPSSAPANATLRLTVRVPHGCGAAPTTSLHVVLPAGSLGVQPMPKAGWSLATTKEALDEPLDDGHGGKITHVVSQVTWSGGRLDSEYYDEFVVRFRTPNRPGTTVPVLATQTCEGGGTAAWTELVAEGQRASAVKMPAPLLRLTGN